MAFLYSPRFQAVRRFCNLLLLGFALSVVVGCQSASTYRPAASPGGIGFSEERLDATHYRVRFTGNSHTSRETVENYLLYRAAEVTLADGYTHFMFLDADTEAKTRYRSTFDTWPGYGLRGYGYYWHDWWWGRPMGFVDTRPITSYSAFASIVLLPAGEGANRAEAFDAGEVVATLGPKLFPAQRN